MENETPKPQEANTKPSNPADVSVQEAAQAAQAVIDSAPPANPEAAPAGEAQEAPQTIDNVTDVGPAVQKELTAPQEIISEAPGEVPPVQPLDPLAGKQAEVIAGVPGPDGVAPTEVVTANADRE